MSALKPKLGNDLKAVEILHVVNCAPFMKFYNRLGARRDANRKRVRER